MTTAKHIPLDTFSLTEEAIKLLDRVNSRPEDDILHSEALRIVRAVWPAAFSVSSPRPLKIHIHKDMEESQLVPPCVIHKALKFFTSQDRYLEAIKPGASRINLLGQKAGKVRLREAVDAEIKRYNLSHPHTEQRERVIIRQIRLVSVKKAS